MQANQDKLARGISAMLTPERCIQIACNSIRKNPFLLKCTPASLLGAISEAATYGWVIDGVTGQASLVPFKSTKLSEQAGRTVYEAVLVPGYKGLRDLVRRAGDCTVTRRHPVVQLDRRRVHCAPGPILAKLEAKPEQGQPLAPRKRRFSRDVHEDGFARCDSSR